MSAELILPETLTPDVRYAARTARDILSGNLPSTLRVDGLTQADLRNAQLGLKRFNREATPGRRALWEINVPRDPAYNEPDDGVITRGVEYKDWKSFLHYRPDLRSLLGERGITLNAWKDVWLSSCHRLWLACVDAYYNLALEMDAVHPVFEEQYHFLERAMACHEQHVLRVLQYKPRTGIIAAEHEDRNAVSLSIAESYPGLYGYWDGERVTCPRPDFPNAIVFTGNQLEDLTNGELPAFRHGVENLNPKHERFSVVFFGKMYGLEGVGS